MTEIMITYNPPPVAEGTLTLTLPEADAKKLMALLGRCNGEHFHKLYSFMNTALPRTGRMELVKKDGLGAFHVDLHNEAKFILA